jgi:hypothetical protein
VRAGWLRVAVALAAGVLGGADPASALFQSFPGFDPKAKPPPAPPSGPTLADFVGGASLTSADGSVTFGDFEVRIQDKRGKTTLDDFVVSAIDGGFAIDLSRAKKATVFLTYTAAATSPGLLVDAALALAGTGKARAQAELQDGRLALAALAVETGLESQADLASLVEVEVAERIALKKKNALAALHAFGVLGSAAPASAVPAPEPGALAWLAPAGALAACRVRSRRGAAPAAHG